MSFFTQPMTTNADQPMIDLRDVNKFYKTAIGDYHALKSIDLCICEGEFVSIIGKSGSGKSTLLNMITGIDRPTSGQVYVNGTAVHELNENRMARWRGKNLGIVFQFFQLLPTISVIENIMLPMDFCRTYPMREREKRALELLGVLGGSDQSEFLGIPEREHQVAFGHPSAAVQRHGSARRADGRGSANDSQRHRPDRRSRPVPSSDPRHPP